LSFIDSLRSHSLLLPHQLLLKAMQLKARRRYLRRSLLSSMIKTRVRCHHGDNRQCQHSWDCLRRSLVPPRRQGDDYGHHWRREGQPYTLETGKLPPMSSQYSGRRRSRERKRAEASKLYGWSNDPRYWDSRYACWHTELEPEPDIYLLQNQTACNLLIRS
jgi:hypothetical protein